MYAAKAEKHNSVLEKEKKNKINQLKKEEPIGLYNGSDYFALNWRKFSVYVHSWNFIRNLLHWPQTTSSILAGAKLRGIIGKKFAYQKAIYIYFLLSFDFFF